MGPALYEATEPKADAELAEDQAGTEGRGAPPGRKARVRRNWTNGKPCNFVVPEELHDAVFIYARKTKVKETSKRKVKSVYITVERTRCKNASEVVCDAIAEYLKKRGAWEDDKAPTGS
jgi:hypothetical protein